MSEVPTIHGPKAKAHRAHLGPFLLDDISVKALEDVIVKEFLLAKPLSRVLKPNAADNRRLAMHLRTTARRRIRQALKKAPLSAYWAPARTMVHRLSKPSPNRSRQPSVVAEKL